MMLSFFPNSLRTSISPLSPSSSLLPRRPGGGCPSCAVARPPGKTPFLGRPIPNPFAPAPRPLAPLRRAFRRPVTGAVKRRKELPFDNVIQRDKKLKLVLKIRKILVSQPERVMSLKDLGKHRRELGLTRKRRFIALLKRFPGVFEIVEEGVYSLKFRLTPAAEQIYAEELRLRNQMEEPLVTKLRKLLMMSLHKRILLEKIAHLAADLGLPPDFRSTLCERHPHFFKVVPTDRGPALELTSWDPALAVSAAEDSAEETRLQEIRDRDLIIDRPPKFARVKLPKGLNLSKGEARRIAQFRDMPFISPYSDFSGLRPGTPEKEKHACAVVHEILSLTVEKKTLVDHLTHFREEFKFSQQLRGMIIRHPDMFYVSLKGDRDSVFLREAYRDSQLVDRDKLSLLKEKMRALLAVPRFSPRRGPREDGEQDDDDEEEEDWSVSDDDDDDQAKDDPQDFWTDDEEDGAAPDFDDDDDDDDDDGDDDDGDGDDGEDDSTSLGAKRTGKRPAGLSQSDEKEVQLPPVFPDGRPRERW
ncbi:ubiquitin carboxyl-terminal hydrolase family protein [Wolffia australiana]